MDASSGHMLRTPLLKGSLLLAGAFLSGASDGAENGPAPAASAAINAMRAAPRDGHIGFVATYFYYAMYQGADACPTGMNPVKTSQEFLSKFPADERSRLLKPESHQELFTKMAERGPNGANICRFPEQSIDPNMPTLAGDRNDGLDLDGSKDDKASSAYTCEHKQYTGDDGAVGVDNQLGRIFACLGGVREKGTLIPYFTQTMRNGMWSMLIDVSGVDDLRNDPEVMVDFYAGDDTMQKDPTGQVLSGASLAPKTDPKLHRQVKGRIRNGVLETAAAEDLMIPDIMLSNRLPPMRIERPKLKLTLMDDGTAKGYLGGYIDIKQYISRSPSAEGEQFTGITCDGMYHAVAKFADGGRDAKTGQCHTISSAFRIEAIPAFIVHPDRIALRGVGASK